MGSFKLKKLNQNPFQRVGLVVTLFLLAFGCTSESSKPSSDEKTSTSTVAPTSRSVGSISSGAGEGTVGAAGPLIEVSPIEAETYIPQSEQTADVEAPENAVDAGDNQDNSQQETAGESEAAGEAGESEAAADPVAEETPAEPANSLPSIQFSSHNQSLKSYISLNSVEEFSYVASDDDGDGLTVKIYLSHSSQICSESNLASWSEIYEGPASPYNYLFENELEYYFCFEVYDGIDRAYKRLPMIFSVLNTEGIQLRLSADNLVTESSASISEWGDSSGLSHHASQADPAKQPQAIIDGDGHPAISFDGSQYFRDAHSYSARTVLAVVKPDSSLGTSDLGQIWGSYSEGVHVAFDPRGSQFGMSFDGSAGVKGKYAVGISDQFSSFLANHGSGSYQDQEKFIVSVEFEGSRSLTSQDIGYLFANTDHTYRGLIYEIIVFDRQLSPETLNAFQTVLNAKWLEAPVVESAPQAPTNISVSSGQGFLSLSWDRGESSEFQISYLAGAEEPADCNSGNIISSALIGGSNSYVIGDLEDSAQFSFKICSLNSTFFPGVFANASAGTATTNPPITAYPTSGLTVHLDAAGVISHSGGVLNSWTDPYSGAVFQNEAGHNNAGFSSTALNGYPGVILNSSSLVAGSSVKYKSAVVVYMVDSSTQNDALLGNIYGNYSSGAQVCQIATDTRSSRNNFSFDGGGSN